MIKLVSTVGFIITNPEGKILLIKQSKEKEEEKVENDNLVVSQKDKEEVIENEWSILFGTVEEDENPREVIKREIKKSLNCEVGDCDYFNLYFYNISDSFIKKACYFYGTVNGEIKMKKSSTTAEWVNLDKEELDKINLAPEQREALNDFINFFQDKYLEKIEQ